VYERMRRKKEAEERDEPLSSAGDSVEAGVLEPLPDLLQQVPARGAICNVVTGRAAFVFSGVEVPNNISSAVLCMIGEGVRVSSAEKTSAFFWPEL